MNDHRTPTRPRPQDRRGLGPLTLFAALAGAILVMLLALYPWSDDTSPTVVNPTPYGEIDDEPLVVTPVPELRLTLDLPALSDEQRYWAKQAEIIPFCPLCAGIDKPPIEFTDNERAVFVSLLYTESNLEPYDEYGHLKSSEIGCLGIAQLCFGLDTPETRDNQHMAIYMAALHFRELIDAEGGDITAALGRYKGVATDDMSWVVDTVFANLRVRS